MNAQEKQTMLPVFRDGRMLAYGMQFNSAQVCEETLAALPHLEKYRGERLKIRAHRAAYQPNLKCHELLFHVQSLKSNDEALFFASALTQFSHAEPESPHVRLYHVVAINEKSGRKHYLTLQPETHHIACVIKSKFNDYPSRRIQLEEVVEHSPNGVAMALNNDVSSTKMAYVLIQEGGSSDELYIHSHESLLDAEEDRVSCSRDGAYRTSEIIEVPENLATQEGFYEIVEKLLVASRHLSCPAAE